MSQIARQTRAIANADPQSIDWSQLVENQEPVILRGLARSWPLTQAGLRAPADAIAYLKTFDQGPAVTVYIGPPEINGRFFYDAALTAMNFTASRARLDAVLALLADRLGDAAAPALYIGSTDADIHLPGFRADNDLALRDPTFAAAPPTVSLWIGNRTTAATHYDFSNNIACCLVGHRRFTLFPPDQISNLYPGPLDPTPGGQVVSLVDLHAPDFARFPRFRAALAAGQVAELGPGDVLFYPAMWWHQVEALDGFNAMMNYWWNTVPPHIDTPMTTLLHGLLSLRDRTDAEKAAWRHVFDHYIFGAAATARAHIPDAAQGPLAPIDDRMARRLRARLLDRLNR